MKKILSLVAVALMAAVGPAGATTIVVPGTSDLWLAGAPAGARASGLTPADVGVDVAPAHSPVAVMLIVGTLYDFTATGCVANAPEYACYGPDGGPWFGDPTVPHYAGAQNGIGEFAAPLDSLIAVWAGSSVPFFVGSHLTFTALAPTLYLGVMDGHEWNNNLGAHIIVYAPVESRRIPDVPEPSTLLLVAAGAVVIISRRR